ncbi:hypothetical protein [Pedobacter nyackensis]|uniref:Outer membrane protein beta-barrel domain-containing protein n=1 Tax=Pedobacter nyackensis TaxID=475255 RepID=A0A1W2C277_9SPHI|nr:hypothetical protein [Pedobacter nyackensis]SMC78818.1 hypothetical protein SAMN04488101_10335 [Pedobacter nyackensis]
MKKCLLVALSLLLTNAAFSQMSGDYNYSIAVRGYSLMQMPKVLNQKNSDKFREAAFSGGILKFNDNQISYRLSGNYFKKDVQIVNNCLNCEEANGKMTDYSFKIGFEKNINFSIIQPYFGFDMGYRSNKFVGMLSSKSSADAAAVAIVPGPDGVEASKSGFTAAPILGVKVNPIPQVTLFAEGNLEFFYSYERQETAGPNQERTFKKFNKSEFLVNPVSIGVQINLGSNR